MNTEIIEEQNNAVQMNISKFTVGQRVSAAVLIIYCFIFGLLILFLTVRQEKTSIFLFSLFSTACLSCIVGLLMARPLRIFFVINITAVFFALYAAEVYVYSAYRPLESGAAASLSAWWEKVKTSNQEIKFIDRREKYEVIRDYQKSGVQAVPLMAGGVFLEAPLLIDGVPVLPLSGIPNRRTVMCNEYGVWSDFLSDEYGFNNPSGSWRQVSPSIAVLGDSFTIGACVPQGENMVDRIRRDFPGALNLGMSASGPLFMLARLKEYLEPVRPKHVIYAYYEGNDLLDLDREKKDPLLLQYLNPEYSQHLVGRKASISNALENLLLQETKNSKNKELMRGDLMQVEVSDKKGFKRSTNYFDFMRFMNLRAFFTRGINYCDANGPYSDENLRLLKKIFERANTLVQSWGGSFSIAYIPEWQSYNDTKHFQCYKRKDKVFEIARSLEVNTLNLAETIKPTELSEYWFNPSTHFGPEGYNRVGATISQHLSK